MEIMLDHWSGYLYKYELTLASTGSEDNPLPSSYYDHSNARKIKKASKMSDNVSRSPSFNDSLHDIINLASLSPIDKNCDKKSGQVIAIYNGHKI